MSKDNSAPAFPSDSNEYGTVLGMSLRDYFAAKAMQGFNANPHYDEYSHEDMAALCYMAADAMLAARSA